MAKNTGKKTVSDSSKTTETAHRNSVTGQFTSNGKNGNQKNGMSAADKATLKAWRLTYDSHRKSSAE